MGTSHCGEIVEHEEGLESECSSVNPEKIFHVEDDINRLFESIKISARMLGSPQVRRDDLRKKSMKRPMRVGPYQASRIEISEPISLKQALRGLSICQASEMAAMKRLSKPGTIKWSQRTSDMVKVSLVPEKSTSNVPENMPKSLPSSNLDHVIRAKTSATELVQRRNLKMKLSSLSTRCKKKLPVVDESVPASIDESVESVMQEKKQKPNFDSLSSLSSSRPGTKSIKLSLKNKNLVKKKNKLDSTFVTNFHQIDDLGPSTSSSGSSSLGSTAGKPDGKKRPNVIVNDKSRLGDKGEFSQSTNSSSLGENSSTSFSDESNLSSGCRPHMSKDLRWKAVNCAQKQHGNLNFRHFKMIRKLGGGDIGTVYLAELINSSCLFALKVVDNEFLGLGNKATRVQTEREILELLDHPFLPTLFAQFTTDKYSCFVTEYCPGGDLHVLRQKQPNKCFSEQAARFYVAELLLALEYLHMLGIVYRDLKPENILVREDGHIMLTDFNLSLKSVPNPTLLKPSSPLERPHDTDPSCTDHYICLQPCFMPRLPLKTRKSKVDLVTQVNPLPQLVVEPTSARSNSFVGTHEYLAPEIIKGDGHGSAVDWWTFGILLYELLYGKTPFKGMGNEDTLANVVSRDLTFADNNVGSPHARDLIRSLLRKKPEKRLGYLKGAAEIKQHPFFEGLNWALIRCATPQNM